VIVMSPGALELVTYDSVSTASVVLWTLGIADLRGSQHVACMLPGANGVTLYTDVLHVNTFTALWVGP